MVFLENGLISWTVSISLTLKKIATKHAKKLRMLKSKKWRWKKLWELNFALENDNFSKYFNLLKLVSDPFKYKEKYVNYYKPPYVLDENFKTFCGT